MSRSIDFGYICTISVNDIDSLLLIDEHRCQSTRFSWLECKDRILLDVSVEYNIILSHAFPIRLLRRNHLDAMKNIWGLCSLWKCENESKLEFRLTSMKSELNWKLAISTAVVWIVQTVWVRIWSRRCFGSLSLSLMRYFYLYRTGRMPTKQHLQITVTHHERSDSIVATNKHVTISKQTTKFCRSVRHKHTCTCESRKFSVEEKRDISTFMHLNILF
jgi:hypothetical protein